MIDKLKEAVLDGDSTVVSELTTSAIEAGHLPAEILDEALIPAMDVVGSEFESGIRFIPEMLISAEAMKASMVILRPLLAESGIPPKGRILIGTVEGDLHDIGKDLVATMLEGAGYEVIDLGVEVTADRFVEAVREFQPDILAISALLTTTMVYMPQVIERLAEAGLRESTEIIVGGAPVTQSYADKIGADGYAEDAAAAVALVKRLLVAVS
jgi:5-methyltetrahydrofolate--homocysteine methyltransferase